MSDHVNHARTARDTVKGSKVLIQYSFMQFTLNVLRESIADYQKILDKMRHELALIESNHLRIRRKNDRLYFGSKDIESGKERAITNDRNAIHRLARREYLEGSIRALEHRIQLLKKVADNSAEANNDIQIMKKLMRFANAGIDLSQVLFTREQNEWINEEFTPNPYNRGSLNYQTAGGIWMRSKSEAILGSWLEGVGLPYRNDDLVRIEGGSNEDRPFRDSYFADIKVPNLIGGITIHEHLGAFQIENYAENSLKRLNDFHNFRITEIDGRPVTTREFTWSFEDDLRDADSIKRLIRRMLLPL